MAILPLVIAPDLRLKQRSLPVEKVDDVLRRFMDDLLETMYHEQGIGLAAVQVGVHKRVLVMDIEQREGKKNPLFVINPEIIIKATECSSFNEGCLSFPDAFAEVIRPESVTVRYLDYFGKEQELVAEGITATCIQHEIDHLDGITFVDHIASIKRDMIMRKMKKRKRYQAE